MSDKVESMDPTVSNIEKARSKVQKGVSAAKEKLQDVGGGIGERAKSLGGDVRERATRVSERAREGYDVAREKAGHGYERARKDLDQLTTDVNAYVRDNPGRSILIAAGVGFLVGFLLRGERRR